MTKKPFLFVMVAATVLTIGCSKRPDEKAEIASPTCADMDKITDPAQKAELLKKCPRSGPEFKASPKKEY